MSCYRRWPCRFVPRSQFRHHRLLRINEILDEKVRPYLMGDGGYLEILSLQDHTLKIRYQGACGSCPSSLTGTLMAIEGMLKQEVDPELEVVPV